MRLYCPCLSASGDAQDYCGLLSEEAVRKNFLLVYELLDEVIDYGFPQNSSSEALKEFVLNDPTVLRQVSVLFLACCAQGSICLSRACPHSHLICSSLSSLASLLLLHATSCGQTVVYYSSHWVLYLAYPPGTAKLRLKTCIDLWAALAVMTVFNAADTGSHTVARRGQGPHRRHQVHSGHQPHWRRAPR